MPAEEDAWPGERERGKWALRIATSESRAVPASHGKAPLLTGSLFNIHPPQLGNSDVPHCPKR